MAEAKYYRELVVWKRSMELVKETYKLLRYLPKDEIYALSGQIRRAVISIPSNIAEGMDVLPKRTMPGSFPWPVDQNMNWRRSC